MDLRREGFYPDFRKCWMVPFTVVPLNLGDGGLSLDHDS